MAQGHAKPDESVDADLFPRVSKKLRDMVQIGSGPDCEPWRRSSAWLFLRQSTSLMCLHRFGASSGRIVYKAVQLLFLVDVCEASTVSISTKYRESLDIGMLFLKKIARKVGKLASILKTSTDLDQQTREFAESVISHSAGVSRNSKAIFDDRWQRVLAHEKIECALEMPGPRELLDATELKFLTNRTTLERHIMADEQDRKADRLPPATMQDSPRIDFEDSSVFPRLTYSFETSNIYVYALLYDFEQWVFHSLQTWIDDERALSRRYGASVCERISSALKSYLNSSIKVYDGDTTRLSRAILTSFTLWMAMEKYLVQKIPLLGHHSTGMSESILADLLLPMKEDMIRLNKIETYLGERARTGRKPDILHPTLSDDSFSVVYALQDDYMVDVEASICDFAEDKQTDVRFKHAACKVKYERMFDEVNEMTCTTIPNLNGYGSRHLQTQCDRCKLQKKMEKINMEPYTLPLSDIKAQKWATVFELVIPSDFALFRDAQYLLLQTWSAIGCTEEQAAAREKEKKKKNLITSPEKLLLRFAENPIPTSVGLLSPMKLRKSMTKSFLDTTWKDYVLSNNIIYELADVGTKSDLLLNNISMGGACLPVISKSSKYAKSLWAFKVHSDDESIARRNDRHENLDEREHSAFASIRVEFGLQVRNIVREITARSLSTKDSEVYDLVFLALNQAGPGTTTSESKILRESHQDYTKEAFCLFLVKQASSLAESVAGSWLEGNTIAICIALLRRCQFLSPSVLVRSQAEKALQDIREILEGWIIAAKNMLGNSSTDETGTQRRVQLILNCHCNFIQTHVTSASMTTTRRSLPPQAMPKLLAAMSALHDNILIDDSIVERLSAHEKSRIHDAQDTMLQAQSIFKSHVEANPAVLREFVKLARPALRFQPAWRRNPRNKSLYISAGQNQPEIRVDLLSGSTIIDGLIENRLPLWMILSEDYRRLFGTQVLEVEPQGAVGSFTTKQVVHGRTYHFISLDRTDGAGIPGLRIEATNACGKRHRYLPAETFSDDLPVAFTTKYHWLQLFATRSIELRETLEANGFDYWMDLEHGRFRLIRVSDGARLVDIHSDTFSRLLKPFECFELSKHVHAFVRDVTTNSGPEAASQQHLSIELVRYDLTFQVHGQRLKCVELGGFEVDQVQADLGTLVGFRNYLTLSHSQAYSSRRIVLIPDVVEGLTIQTTRRNVVDHHDVNLDLSEISRHFRYDIDTDLKTIRGQSSRANIYLAFLLAATASSMDNPFNDITGTTHAVELLSSPACAVQFGDADLSVLLAKIAALSRKRSYYPSNRTWCQRVDDPLNKSAMGVSFPTLASFDGLAYLAHRLHVLAHQSDFLSSVQNRDPVPNILDDKLEILCRTATSDQLKWYPGNIAVNLGLEPQRNPVVVPIWNQEKNDVVYMAHYVIHSPSGTTAAGYEKEVYRALELLKRPIDPGSKLPLSEIENWRDYSIQDFPVLFLRARSAGSNRGTNYHDIRLMYLLTNIAFRATISQYDMVKKLILTLLIIFYQLGDGKFERPQGMSDRQYKTKDKDTFEAIKVDVVSNIKSFIRAQYPFGAEQEAVYWPESDEIPNHDIVFPGDTADVALERIDKTVAYWEHNAEFQLFSDSLRSKLIQISLTDRIPSLSHPLSVESNATPQPFLADATILEQLYPSFGSQYLRDIQALQEPPESFFQSLSDPSSTAVSSVEQFLVDLGPQAQQCPLMQAFLLELGVSNNALRCKSDDELTETRQINRALGVSEFRTETLLKMNRAAELYTKLELSVRMFLSREAEEAYIDPIIDAVFDVLFDSSMVNFSLADLLARLNPNHARPLPAKLQQDVVILGTLLNAKRRWRRIFRLLDTRTADWASLEAELKNVESVDYVKYPTFLLFELENNLTIRDRQLELVEYLLAAPDSTIVQLNMGEGKSSVVVPLLLSLLSHSRSSLSRVCVPMNLLKLAEQDLRFCMSGWLSRQCYTVPFNRARRLSTQDLDQLLELYPSMARNGFVVSNPEAILSFELMTQESAAWHEDMFSLKYRAVKEWIGAHVKDILDESDELLSPKWQLNYTVGSHIVVDGEALRWTTIEGILHMLMIVVKPLSEKFPGKLSVAVDRDESRASSLFPRVTIFDDSIYPHICVAIMQAIVDGRCSQITLPPLRTDQNAQVFRFVQHQTLTMDDASKIRQWFPDGAPSIQLHTLRGILGCGVLLHALKKRWRVDYGVALTGHRKTAVPFRAKDVPANNAEFAAADVQITLTYLSYLYSGLSSTQVMEVISNISQYPNAHSLYNSWFESQPAVSFGSINLEDIEDVVWPTLRYNIAAIGHYLDFKILPAECKQFQQKLCASTWQLARRKNHTTIGFSGTNDNTKFLFPLSITQNDIESLTHTNAHTLALIISEEEQVKFVSSTEHLLEKVLTMNIHTVLDAGAIIDDLTNLEFIDAWLPRAGAEIQAAIYFDGDQLMVKSRKGRVEELISSTWKERLEQCLVYLDDAHTRGTDLKQPPGRVAALTIGKDLTRTKLAQAAGRMRRLAVDQSLVFLAHTDSGLISGEGCLHQSLYAVDVLKWTVANTIRQTRNYVLQWAQQGLTHAAKESAFEQFAKDGNRSRYFQAILDHETTSLTELYGSSNVMRPIPEIVEGRIATIKSKNSDFDTDERSLAERIHSQVLEFGWKIQSFSHELEEEQEKELEQELEEQRQKEIFDRREAKPQSVIHPDILKLAQGTFSATSQAFKPLPYIFSRTRLRANVQGSAWETNLHATVDFCHAVESQGGETDDRYLRSPNWAVSVEVRGTNHKILLSPREMAKLLPVVRDQEQPKITLHQVSAKVFGDQPDLLRESALMIGRPDPSLTNRQYVQIMVAAGSLYFREHSEEAELASWLGLSLLPRSSQAQKLFDEGHIDQSGFVDPDYFSHLSISSTFKSSPILMVRSIIEMRGLDRFLQGSHLSNIVKARSSFVDQSSLEDVEMHDISQYFEMQDMYVYAPGFDQPHQTSPDTVQENDAEISKIEEDILDYGASRVPVPIAVLPESTSSLGTISPVQNDDVPLFQPDFEAACPTTPPKIRVKNESVHQDSILELSDDEENVKSNIKAEAQVIDLTSQSQIASTPGTSRIKRELEEQSERRRKKRMIRRSGSGGTWFAPVSID